MRALIAVSAFCAGMGVIAAVLHDWPWVGIWTIYVAAWSA